jgi:hypothetical protein
MITATIKDTIIHKSLCIVGKKFSPETIEAVTANNTDANIQLNRNTKMDSNTFAKFFIIYN